jgi:hypothetical protein
MQKAGQVGFGCCVGAPGDFLYPMRYQELAIYMNIYSLF